MHACQTLVFALWVIHVPSMLVAQAPLLSTTTYPAIIPELPTTNSGNLLCLPVDKSRKFFLTNPGHGLGKGPVVSTIQEFDKLVMEDIFLAEPTRSAYFTSLVGCGLQGMPIQYLASYFCAVVLSYSYSGCSNLTQSPVLPLCYETCTQHVKSIESQLNNQQGCDPNLVNGKLNALSNTSTETPNSSNIQPTSFVPGNKYTYKLDPQPFCALLVMSGTNKTQTCVPGTEPDCGHSSLQSTCTGTTCLQSSPLCPNSPPPPLVASPIINPIPSGPNNTSLEQASDVPQNPGFEQVPGVPNTNQFTSRESNSNSLTKIAIYSGISLVGFGLLFALISVCLIRKSRRNQQQQQQFGKRIDGFIDASIAQNILTDEPQNADKPLSRNIRHPSQRVISIPTPNNTAVSIDTDLPNNPLTSPMNFVFPLPPSSYDAQHSDVSSHELAIRMSMPTSNFSKRRTHCPPALNLQTGSLSSGNHTPSPILYSFASPSHKLLPSMPYPTAPVMSRSSYRVGSLRLSNSNKLDKTPDPSWSPNTSFLTYTNGIRHTDSSCQQPMPRTGTSPPTSVVNMQPLLEHRQSMTPSFIASIRPRRESYCSAYDDPVQAIHVYDSGSGTSALKQLHSSMSTRNAHLNYEASQPDEVSVSVGDMVLVLEEGYNWTNQTSGIFPMAVFQVPPEGVHNLHLRVEDE